MTKRLSLAHRSELRAVHLRHALELKQRVPVKSAPGLDGFTDGIRDSSREVGKPARPFRPYNRATFDPYPRSRLGVYEVIASIGQGGMGQVFRARDTKLDRDVAIKILPEAFAHDADRLARFQGEAKTLASLNHPNIAAIHGLEESGGVTAIVMELVEGDDLHSAPRAERFHSTRHCRSRSRSRTHSKPRTSRASFTAT